MAVIEPETVILMVYGVLLVLGAGLYVRWRLPKWKKEAFKEGEQWIGGTLGRFLQAASAKEGESGEGPSAAGGGGGLNLGGFKLDASTIQSIAEILKVVQGLGFLRGGGSGGGGKIGL